MSLFPSTRRAAHRGGMLDRQLEAQFTLDTAAGKYETMRPLKAQEAQARLLRQSQYAVDTIGRLYAGAPTSHAQPTFAAGESVLPAVSTVPTPTAPSAALPAGAGSVAAAAVSAAAALAAVPAVALAQAVGVAAEAAVRHPSSPASDQLPPQPTPQPAVLLQSSLPCTLSVPSTSAAVLRSTDSQAAADSLMQLPDALPSVTEMASGSEVQPTVVDSRVQHLILQLQRDVMQQSARTESMVQQTLVCAQQQLMQQQLMQQQQQLKHQTDMQQVLLLLQQLQQAPQQQQQAAQQPDRQPAQQPVPSHAAQSAPGDPQMFRAPLPPAARDGDSGGACSAAHAACIMHLQSTHAFSQHHLHMYAHPTISYRQYSA